MWNPVYRGDIIKLEKVQNKMTRLIREGSRIRPEERNARFQITSHEIRRKRGDFINIYKNLSNTSLFTLRENNRTRGHEKTLVIPAYRTDIRRHSFAYRSLQEWNSLPEYVVNATTLNQFKTNIDEYLSTI